MKGREGIIIKTGTKLTTFSFNNSNLFQTSIKTISGSSSKHEDSEQLGKNGNQEVLGKPGGVGESHKLLGKPPLK